MRRVQLVVAGVVLTSGLTSAPLRELSAHADRVVAWTTAGEAALERELNVQAARGLRVAAVSDGLPCTVTVLQAPEPAMPPVEYKVVADRDLDAMLGPLGAEGFTPRIAHRRVSGRAHVIFERAGTDRSTSTWRLVEFSDLNALQPAIAAAAGDGFQARMLVRYPLRSWPGLSERGLILASKSDSSRPREVEIVVGQSNRIDAAAKGVADAASKGFSFDLLFTGSRDGGAYTRRERLLVLMSREAGAAEPGEVRLERASSFGTFGSGVPLGVAPFWDTYYVYAWSPARRRQTWATPIRLSATEASCAALPLKLRFDAPRDQAWDIVALPARKLTNGEFELVYVTDQRFGFSADASRGR